jgi:hypothetical protein
MTTDTPPPGIGHNRPPLDRQPGDDARPDECAPIEPVKLRRLSPEPEAESNKPSWLRPEWWARRLGQERPKHRPDLKGLVRWLRSKGWLPADFLYPGEEKDEREDAYKAGIQAAARDLFPGRYKQTVKPVKGDEFTPRYGGQIGVVDAMHPMLTRYRIESFKLDYAHWQKTGEMPTGVAEKYWFAILSAKNDIPDKKQLGNIIGTAAPKPMAPPRPGSRIRPVGAIEWDQTARLLGREPPMPPKDPKAFTRLKPKQMRPEAEVDAERATWPKFELPKTIDALVDGRTARLGLSNAETSTPEADPNPHRVPKAAERTERAERTAERADLEALQTRKDNMERQRDRHAYHRRDDQTPGPDSDDA